MAEGNAEARPAPRKGGRPQSFSDEQVFRTITELVIEGGVDAISMPAIAKRIGFSHQAVTYRFSTRENLLRAYGAWYLANLERAVTRLEGGGRSALTGLLDFLTGRSNDEILGVTSSGGPAEPLKLMLEFDREPVLRRFFAPSREQTVAWMGARIAEAQAQGEIGAEHDPCDVAEALLFAVSGAVILHAWEPVEQIDAHTERAIRRTLKPYVP